MRQPLVFGKYLLLERISVGGMAEVFKAKYFGEEGFEKILAIKRILPSMMEDEQFIHMFVDEAKIAGELSHPNIGQIFELGKIDDVHFIAMEFVWGKDVLQIQNRIRRLRQKMPLEMAAHIASKVCEGLDYAHHKTDAGGREMHIIHRDVSPQNILVSYSGEVKIIDFGIAKARSRSSKTQAGVLKGKFGYMSPEQVRGKTLDQRSDIFSIGTLLYEMVTSERLFTGETDFATLDKVRNADVIPPSQVNPAVPPELDTIIMSALRREPEERYQWASDMQEDLAAYVRAGRPIFSSKPLGKGVREMFDAERKREMARLEEYNKIKKAEMDNFSRPPDAGQGEMVMSLLPLEPVQGDQDPALTARPEDDMEGEATVVGGMPGFGMEDNESTPMYQPEVQVAMPFAGDDEGATQIFSTGAGLDLGQQEPGMAGESTHIFDGGEDPGGALAMADESTVIFGGDAPGGPGGNGHGAPALADGDIPDQGSTVLFDTTGGEQRAAAMGMDVSAFPTDDVAPSEPISGTVPVQLETARSSSLIKDILIGVLVALVVILVVVIWRLFASGGIGTSNPATLVITATPPQAAEVLVDGQRKGAMVPGNPFTLKDVSPQEHTITLKRANLPDVKRTVTLEPGDVKVLSIALTASAMAAAKPDPALRPKATPLIETKPDASPPDAGESKAVAAVKPNVAPPAKPEPAAKPAPAVAAVAKPAPAAKPAPKAVAVAKPAPKPASKPVAKPKTVVAKPAPKPAPKVAATPAGKPIILRPNATKDPFGGSSKAKPAAKPKTAVAKPRPRPRSKPKVVVASTKGKGFLVANTKPWAKVIVDGKDTGKTTPILPRAKIALQPGSHKVTFKVDGKQFHYNVKIVAGETARLIKKLPVN